MLSTLALVSTLCLSAGFLLDGERQKPNVIFIMADDLGYADVGFRNKDIISPNLDNLAREGILLNQSYVQPTCSPSRAAWLTGRYPFKLGMHSPITMHERDCLSLSETLLPEKLKTQGYKTHAIGKWHLGFCDWVCTPTYRGFDTFYGIYGGGGDKFEHEAGAGKGSYNGYDFRENENILESVKGKYSADLYGQRAVDLIRSHNTSSPMYMWLAFQNVHSPIEAPLKYTQMYPGSPSNTASFYGMITILDEYVGKIVAELKSRNMYDNTLLVFTTDNGGDISLGANNHPLRGQKRTIFEGGTRGVGFVAGTKVVASSGYVNNGLIHAIDWLPTIMHFAMGKEQEDNSLDGVDQYDMIYNNGASKRQEMIYRITARGSAIRSGEWKLILGNPGTFQGWSTGVEPPTSVSQREHTLYGMARSEERLRRQRPNRPDKPQAGRNQTSSDTVADRSQTTDRPSGGGANNDPQNQTPWLFNLRDDPLEKTNLADMYPDIIAELSAKIETARREFVRQKKPEDASSDPSNFGGHWSPGWCPGGP